MLALCRTRLTSRLLCLSAVGFGAAAAQAQVLYSEDFDSDVTASWQANPHPTTDTHADFFFDYSTVGIPCAPNSVCTCLCEFDSVEGVNVFDLLAYLDLWFTQAAGADIDGTPGVNVFDLLSYLDCWFPASAGEPCGSTTRGMKLQANLMTGLFGGFTASPVGLDLEALSDSGNYTLTFDLWSNTVGQFPGGGSGSTNLSLYGILSSGTVSNYPGIADGVYFANSPEGGTGPDYRVYSPASPASHQDGDLVYVAPSHSRDNSDAYYETAFPMGATPPAAQAALYSQQTGQLDPGTIGMAWHAVRIVKENGLVAWWVDDTLMALVDASSMATGGGDILFGHSDINNGRSLDPDAPDLIFTLIDNIEVVEGNPVVDPTGACCNPLGTCSVMTHIACVSSGGEYQGDGTPCTEGLCPAIAGACCLNDGTCIDDVSENGCLDMAGVFNGLGTTCAGVPPCPDVRPPNDECAGAEAITSLPAFVSGNTLTATSSGSPGCTGVTDGSFGDVWYTVVGTGARLIATTCPGAPAPSPSSQFSDFDSQIRVYTGGCGALACETANFDAPALGCNQEFRAAWDSVLGETYYILVSNFAQEVGGQFEMAVFEDATGACCFPDGTCTDLTSGDCGTQGGVFNGFSATCATLGGCPVLLPPNDDCASATTITAGEAAFQEVEFSEGNDAESNCAPSSQDLWWSFTPTVSGPYTIDTIGSSGFNDTTLDIFVGCGGPVLFCDDDGAGVAFLSEAKDLFLDAGTNYRIRAAVWGTAGGAAGDMSVFITPEPIVEGACCVGTTCSIMDPATCASSGGTYQGDFTTCGENDLDLRDDGSARVELPFPFTYWGTPRDHVIVSANGFLTFADDGSEGTNHTIPDGQNPLSVIAPLWDDFNPEFQGSVNADVRGAGASQRLVVQWNNVPQFGEADSFTFEAIIFADGSIEFRYGTIVPEAVAGDYSVGLSNAIGGTGLSIPGASIMDGLCIHFAPDGLGGYTQTPCGNALEDITIPINPCE